ncbi:MAG: nucleotide exchange factor GrpE [Candidatus Doudnabacteria bacterium RIFCSPHIGHO2_01_FULL_50_11]|uniref:Protein GrpE n=1 Tax=Candidatus Doudnabacteria bacterium RIFCSPHIGHO2_01_FULL_50_11 TaxID=1817828 RepID=A0A1F5PFZ3_9BACT|nr:MAG: nucleotide exchange factor GrpE [Candidatus Doudnabacteria bacterium RIFCSPHIGHO2_01_FULL_50_11]
MEETSTQEKQADKSHDASHSPKQQLEEVRRQAEEYLNAWKRAAADFENYQKRRAREDQELLRMSKEWTILKLLPSLEALDLALKQVPSSDSHRIWAEGIGKILDSLDAALKEQGVERVKTVGERFNHELHEATEMVPDPQRSGIVVEEVAPGYLVNGRVVRPAKVKVGK